MNSCTIYCIRIHVLYGNLVEFNFDSIVKLEIHLVIHAAAMVKHFGKYEDFFNANVLTTQKIIEFCKDYNIRLFYISTKSICGSYIPNTEKILFNEESYNVGQVFENMYAKSKFCAEGIVHLQCLHGLDAVVLRVGNLTNRSFDYKFQTNYDQNDFINKVKGILDLGVIPYEMANQRIDISPVDLTSKAIVALSEYSFSGIKVLHIFDDEMTVKELIEILMSLGIKVQLSEMNDYRMRLNQALYAHTNDSVYCLLQEQLESYMKKEFTYYNIDNAFTKKILRKVSFSWKYDVSEYLKGWIEYFCNIGVFNF